MTAGDPPPWPGAQPPLPPAGTPPPYPPPGPPPPYSPPGPPPQYWAPGYPQQPPGYPPYGAYPGAWMPAGPRRRGLHPLAWVGIGCGGLVALGVVGLIVAGVWLFTHAPLKDFPTYPGSSQTSDNITYQNGTHEVRVWRAPADSTSVEAWYRTNLAGTKWTIDTGSSVGDVIAYHTSDGARGDITFSSSGGTSTTVTVTYDGS